MCARYCFLGGPKLRDLFRMVEGGDLEAMVNIAPTMWALSVVAEDGEPRLRRMQWGFVPRWRKDLVGTTRQINARSESVAEKPTFRDAFLHRRCVLPASGFYEWKGEGRTKQCHWIGLPDQRTFGMAGVWEEWQGTPSFAIVTSGPNSQMATVHDRMPVMLFGEELLAWLVASDHGVLQRVMAPKEFDLDIYPVDSPKDGPRPGGGQGSLF